MRLKISIHALREEGDSVTRCSRELTEEFLSTPSARRATLQRRGGVRRMGNFYPRPPRGGRQNQRAILDSVAKFLSTPSARRATTATDEQAFGYQISIHALREEGDDVQHTGAGRPSLFLSTPSARRATSAKPSVHPGHQFLSTPSARRATAFIIPLFHPGSDFYPRPPRGGRQQKQRQNLYFQTNYTTFCTNLEEP